MKYVYIILIGALLIGCGASDDGDKGNSSGDASAKGGNTASGTPATKGSNTSSTPKAKGDNTSGTPAKGDTIPSPKYTEGDTVVILKNANKSSAKSYSSDMRNLAKEKGLMIRSKDLESENCVSLGFVYKATTNKNGGTEKEFTKGEAKCTERTMTDSAKVGNFNILFLFRN